MKKPANVIYKHVQSHIIPLHQHVSVTPVTIIMFTEVTKTYLWRVITVVEHIYKHASVGLSFKYKTFISGVNILNKFTYCAQKCASVQTPNSRTWTWTVNLMSSLFSFYFHSFNVRIRCHKPIQTFVFKPDIAI
jgi:hypothetical protein